MSTKDALELEIVSAGTQDSFITVDIDQNNDDAKMDSPQTIKTNTQDTDQKDGNTDSDSDAAQDVIDIPLKNEKDRQALTDKIDNAELWKHLKANQCPLMPQRYEKNGSRVAAYYFNNDLWIQDENDDKLCRRVTFSKDKIKQQVCDNAELMLAVDKYISYVHINKSYEIYSKLTNAKKEANTDFDDGNKENDAYQKLIPTMMARIMFLTIFITTVLNAYFIGISIKTAALKQYDTSFMNTFALVMSICECILYANTLFGRIIAFGLALIFNLMTNRATDMQSKIIAIELRNISTLSILRYLPSIEIVSSWIIHWREKLSKLYVDFIVLFQRSNVDKAKNLCDVIFAIPMYVVESVAPILALFAVLVKVKQLGFVVDGDPFADWNATQYLTFVAFLNQVAGLRVLRNVETASIQHFVFSGADAELSTDELLILDNWWNITLLSAVSNLDLGWYDNMVFWYGLDPQKIQLLLKNHVTGQSGHDKEIEEAGGVLEYAKKNDKLLDNYTRKVAKEILQKKNN